VFEFAEFNVVQEKDALIKFITKIRKLGSEFAVDHFGLHHSSLEYLQALCPFYIKLSSTYVSDLLVNRDNQAYVSSLSVIAKTLNIKVIAVGIEDESLFDLLEKLGVYGYQGYVTGVPVRII
jgi:EAL domain-containing protein (putative c-di-GMP-specific phosphodiesterase class I)